jgi:hypothetical protein
MAKEFKQTSEPVFKKLSWAIAYAVASTEDPKFYRVCDSADESSYIYDESSGAKSWAVTETFMIDGMEFVSFQIDGVKYWSLSQGE